MAIFIRKDGWPNPSEVIAVTPDKSGTYVAEIQEALPIPQALHPLCQPELKPFLSYSTSDHREPLVLQQDFSHINPRKVEQILFIRGLDEFKPKVYLSPEGKGASVGLRPQPQPEPHRLEVILFGQIRPDGEYRRQRVYNSDRKNGRVRKEVVGWITQTEHDTRRGYTRERRG